MSQIYRFQQTLVMISNGQILNNADCNSCLIQGKWCAERARTLKLCLCHTHTHTYSHTLSLLFEARQLVLVCFVPHLGKA